MKRLLLALVLIGAAVGCGQKGPLRVAEPPTQAAPAPEAGAAADAGTERDDDERRPPRR